MADFNTLLLLLSLVYIFRIYIQAKSIAFCSDLTKVFVSPASFNTLIRGIPAGGETRPIRRSKASNILTGVHFFNCIPAIEII